MHPTSVSIDTKIFKLVRAKNGLSQEELCRKSGVAIATIKRIEASHPSYACRITTATRLASALGVGVADLEDDGLAVFFDVGGDIELRLTASTTEHEIRDGAEKILALASRRLRLMKNDKL